MTEFAGIALLVTLSVWHGRTERYGPLWMVLYKLPSTILHEFCHFLIAGATLSGPTGFTVWPKRSGEGWILGCVTCDGIGRFSALPVGLAPALIGLPLAWQAYQLHNLLGYVWVYLCLTASVPSKADVEVALSSLTGLVWWAVAGTGIWMYAR
jgi:hypothetical protein